MRAAGRSESQRSEDPLVPTITFGSHEGGFNTLLHTLTSPDPMPPPGGAPGDPMARLSLPPYEQPAAGPRFYPPNEVDPFLAEEAAVATLTQLVGAEWSFLVLKEHLSPGAVAVLAEVSVRGVTRQHWGSVLCAEGQPPAHALAGATAASLSAAARLYRAGMQPLPIPPTPTAFTGILSATPPRVYCRATSMPMPSHSHSGTMHSPQPLGNRSAPPLIPTTISSPAPAPPLSEMRSSSSLSSGGLSGSVVPDATMPTPFPYGTNSSSGGVEGPMAATRQSGVEWRDGMPPPPPAPPYASHSAFPYAPKVLLPTSRLASSTPQSPTHAAAEEKPLLGMKSLPLNGGLGTTSRPIFPSPLSSPDRSGVARSVSTLSIGSEAPPTPVSVGGGSNGGSPAGPVAEGEVKEGPKVLIVDDEPVNVRVVKRVLDRANFVVHTGSDGTDVMERVVEQHEKFDALLLDERLKVMNGSEACLKVREYEVASQLPEMPIIAISANVEPEDLRKYAHVGYSAVMGKPINVRVAGDRLKKFMASYKSMAPARRAEIRRGEPPIIKKSEDIILFM